VNATVKIDLESSGISGAEMVNQIVVFPGSNGTGGGPFFGGGDSGSLVVHSASQQPLGILVGGDRDFTVVSPLTEVLRDLHPPGDLFEIVTQ
jgi:hypothetical protein